MLVGEHANKNVIAVAEIDAEGFDVGNLHGERLSDLFGVVLGGAVVDAKRRAMN
jgi:hypothetical protein